MKAATNNGQAHVDWCVGLKLALTGRQAVRSRPRTPTRTGRSPYVGLAPPCPKANPSSMAPCLVSQTGDGSGGSIVTGWFPGGDPPRRP